MPYFVFMTVIYPKIGKMHTPSKSLTVIEWWLLFVLPYILIFELLAVWVYFYEP